MEKMNWFEIWCDDWESLIYTQSRNVQAELDAGYKWSSRHVQHEVEILNEFDSKYRNQLAKFAEMEEQGRNVNKWCYYDLLRRGAITR